MLTIDSVMALRPCDAYPRERVEELFWGRKEVTLEEALTNTRIPVNDRIWLALQDGVMPEKSRAKAIETIVTRAVRNHALHCGIPAVEAWAARWLDGSDRSEAAAWAAASAAWAAASAEAEARAEERNLQLDDILAALKEEA